MPKIQLGDAEYRIVGDRGEEGEVMLYGQPAVLDCEGGQFMTTWDLNEEGDPVCKLKKGMMINTDSGQTIQVVETEDADFQFTAGDDDDDGDEDEDEDEDLGEDEDEDLDDDEDEDEDEGVVIEDGDEGGEEEPELEALRRQL